MTEADIAEMFIRAAETERKMPQVRGMKETTGGYVLPWVHDLADINSRRRTGDRRTEKLILGEDPLREWETAWLDEWAKRATKAQIADWEACIKITGEFLTDPGQRRALWAWALSQADNLIITRPSRTPKKISFARWCREVERVSEMTGHRRKNRALAAIVQGLCGKPGLHDGNRQGEVLPCEPESGHIFATIEGQSTVFDTQPVYSWRDDPSFRKTGMTILEWRAAKRRQREEQKRKAA